MHSKIKIIYSFFALLFISSFIYAEERKIKEVKGLFSVETPQDGLVWGKVSNPQLSDKEGEIYICGKPSPEKMIMLSVEREKLTRASSRIGNLKKHYQESHQQFDSIIGEVIDEIELPEKTPVPDRVLQGITFKTKDGKLICCRYLKIFGENTYTISVATTTEKETKEIIDSMAKSFKELATPSQDIFKAPGMFSIGKPSREYTWQKNKEKDSIRYECQKKDSPLKIVLFFVDKKIDSKDGQQKLLESFAKQRAEQLIKDNYKIVNEPKILLSPYDDHEGVYSIKAKNAKGEVISLKCIGMFEKKTYVLEVFGPEKENPPGMCNKLVNSFEELVK